MRLVNTAFLATTMLVSSTTLAIADVKVIYSYLEDGLNQATAEQRKVGLGLCDFIFIMLQDLPEQSEEILSTARHNRIHCGLY